MIRRIAGNKKAAGGNRRLNQNLGLVTEIPYNATDGQDHIRSPATRNGCMLQWSVLPKRGITMSLKALLRKAAPDLALRKEITKQIDVLYAIKNAQDNTAG